MRDSIAVSFLFFSLSSFAEIDFENSYIARSNIQINGNCSDTQRIINSAAKEFKFRESNIKPLHHSVRVPCSEGQNPVLNMELALIPQNNNELHQVEDYLKEHNGKPIFGVQIVFEKFQVSYGQQKFSAYSFQGGNSVNYKKRVLYSDFNSMVFENSELKRTFQFGGIGDAIQLIAGLFDQPYETIEKSWNKTNYRYLTVEVAVKTENQEFLSNIMSYWFGVSAARNWE